jgi:hypothetical protein
MKPEQAVQGIPTYSLVTSSNCKTTSNVLKPAWDLVKDIRNDSFAEDSQVVSREAVMPNAKYLGMALSDHWGIAIPFEQSPNQLVRDLVNHNNYPWGQIFESIFRMVTGDLTKTNRTK